MSTQSIAPSRNSRTAVRSKERVKIRPPASRTEYPVVVGPHHRNWSAGAVDFPAVTTANTREVLLRRAGEQIALHLLEHQIEGSVAPSPTQPADLDLEYLDEFDDDYEIVYVEPAKLSEFGTAIYKAMAEEGVNETELARRLGVSHTLANRISDPLYFGHTSNTLRKVARALGREIVVSLD